jgi:hypothetical protein
MQQAAPPPATGAASCRPRDGDAWPAVTGRPGHQQSPRVRQGWSALPPVPRFRDDVTGPHGARLDHRSGHRCCPLRLQAGSRS